METIIRGHRVMVRRLPTDDQPYYELWIDGVYSGEFTKRDNCWIAADLLIDSELGE